MRDHSSLALSLILLFSAIFIGFLSVDSINAESTIYVDSSGSEDFISIQAAIDSANFGDTIYVNNATYFENIHINKSINLIGEDKFNTIINGMGNPVLQISSSSVEIQGFTFTDGSYAILLQNSFNVIIKNNTITNSNTGIQIDSTNSNNTIFYNNFINNSNHAYDESSTSQYYSGSTGNYWDDYSGLDDDEDGIGDTPYDVAGGINQDMYPLIGYITKKPLVSFIYSPSNPTTQDVISFNDYSEDSDGYITSWLWDFDDGSNSTEKNPLHSFNDDGVYEVVLVATDNYGSINQATQIITVLNTGPVAGFTINPKVPLDTQSVEFKDTSTDIDGNIINRTWIINDTLFFYDASFQYKFPDDGIYTVKLEVTDDDGLTSSLSQDVNVLNAGPIASFTYSSINESIMKNDLIHFQDSSHDSDGDIIFYHWTFDDGTSSDEKNPTHFYSEDGIYKISLTISDNDGASNTFSKSIKIGETFESSNVIFGLSLFDIIIVSFIMLMIVFVIIISKKYS